MNDAGNRPFRGGLDITAPRYQPARGAISVRRGVRRAERRALRTRCLLEDLHHIANAQRDLVLALRLEVVRGCACSPSRKGPHVSLRCTGQQPPRRAGAAAPTPCTSSVRHETVRVMDGSYCCLRPARSVTHRARGWQCAGPHLSSELSLAAMPLGRERSLLERSPVARPAFWPMRARVRARRPRCRLRHGQRPSPPPPECFGSEQTDQALVKEARRSRVCCAGFRTGGGALVCGPPMRLQSLAVFKIASLSQTLLVTPLRARRPRQDIVFKSCLSAGLSKHPVYCPVLRQDSRAASRASERGRVPA